MAGRPRKNADNPVKKDRKSKSVVEEVIVEAPVVEEVIAEEVPAVETEQPVTEIVTEEEIKPKRKYTKRTKTVEETPVIVEAEEEPKPKRKYTRHVKPVEVPEEVTAETVSAPKLSAYIQGAGAEISFEELSATAVKLSGVKSPKTVNLYIKPYEDDGVAKVYYVVDNKAGHFNLFN